MDFDALRAEALSQTVPELSRRILARCERLVAHPSPSGFGGIHYQDFDLKGAIGCTAEEAMLLYRLVRLIEPRYPLEIGSYAGWSTAHLLAGLRGGLQCVDTGTEVAGDRFRLTTCRNDEPVTARARMAENLRRCGLNHYALSVDASPDCLAGLAPVAGWDFAFLDGEHNNGQPVRDVDGLVEQMHDDGVIVLHDVWLPDVRKALERLRSLDYVAFTLPTANLLTVMWREWRADGWMASLKRLEALHTHPDERLRERMKELQL